MVCSSLCPSVDASSQQISYFCAKLFLLPKILAGIFSDHIWRSFLLSSLLCSLSKNTPSTLSLLFIPLLLPPSSTVLFCPLSSSCHVLVPLNLLSPLLLVVLPLTSHFRRDICDWSPCAPHQGHLWSCCTQACQHLFPSHWPHILVSKHTHTHPHTQKKNLWNLKLTCLLKVNLNLSQLTSKALVLQVLPPWSDFITWNSCSVHSSLFLLTLFGSTCDTVSLTYPLTLLAYHLTKFNPPQIGSFSKLIWSLNIHFTLNLLSLLHTGDTVFTATTEILAGVWLIFRKHFLIRLNVS